MPLYSPNHPSQIAAPESPWRALVRTLATFILRAGAGVLIATGRLYPELAPGWNFVWNGTPWEFVDTVASTGTPLSFIVAPTFVAIALIATVALVAGLLTRVSAIILTVLAFLAFPTAFALGYGENTLLYMLIFGAITLLGPGLLSLDALLTYRRPPRPLRPLA